MDTKKLFAFKAFAETGSFQKAAQKLNYETNTLFYQLTSLEEELSLQLFETVGRNKVLTQAGKDILPYCNTILQATEQIQNYGKDLSKITGTLRIALPDSTLTYNILHFIENYCQKAPNIQIIINTLPANAISQAVLNDQADIGIICDEKKLSASFTQNHLISFKCYLVASPLIKCTEQDFITPNLQKSISMIYNDPSIHYQKAINRYLQKKNIVLNPHIQLYSIEAVKHSVLNGLGIAYLPLFTIKEELSDGSLIQLNTELDEMIYNVSYVYRSSKWISPQMQLAFDTMNERPDIEYFE